MPPIPREVHEAALRYAQFDKSDPHSYNRAISHYVTGAASATRGGSQIAAVATSAKPHDEIKFPERGATYDASEFVETKSYKQQDGKDVYFKSPAYRGIVRP